MKKEIKFSLVYRDMWQSSGKYQPRADQLVRIAPLIIEMGCFSRVETNGGAFEQVNILYGENPNKAVRAFTKPVRDQTFVDQTDNLYHLNLPQDSGFESTEGAYDLKEMHRIVNALPKEYKVPFSMHVSGFKYREIAEKLDLPLGTVKSRIFFTRQRLQQELKDFV